MAVTATLVPGGRRAKVWTVTFGADGDTTIAIPHGFNGTPDHVEFFPLTPEAYVGQITQGLTDATNVTLNKVAALGSGGASVRLYAYIPNSSL